MFEGFDPKAFWERSAYTRKAYTDDPPTTETVAEVERALGYRLPAAYVELMRFQNGGIPRLTNHRTAEPTSWADDHIAISGIYSIGSARPNSLCGQFGSRFWIDEWGYPPIGSTSPTVRRPATIWSAWTTAPAGLRASPAWSTSTRSATTRSPSSRRASRLSFVAWRATTPSTRPSRVSLFGTGVADYAI